MREESRPSKQRLLFPGVWIYIPLILLLLLFAYRAFTVENNYSFYWRDPAAIVVTSPWIGLFSSIGVFIWWIGVAISVFTALVLWRVPNERRRAALLLAFGLFTGMLALDDFFMVHEWIVPTYLPLSDNFAFSVYIVIGIVLFITFRRELLDSLYLVLLLAAGCLALSVVIDIFVFEWLQQRGLYPRLVLNLEYIVEDGLKLVGLIAWSHYFALTSFQAIQDNLAKHPAPR